MKRPWNIINTPVYSLATYCNDAINMNICTYVTAISMKPKLYAIAVYEHTKTLENILQTDTAVLQLLNISHTKLVNILGKKTGKIYNKQAYLIKHNLLTNWQNQTVLKNANAYLLLKKVSGQLIGDHHLFAFEVVKYTTMKEESVLQFQDLIEQKIIL